MHVEYPKRGMTYILCGATFIHNKHKFISPTLKVNFLIVSNNISTLLENYAHLQLLLLVLNVN